MHSTSQEVYSELIFQFPKLADGGGFEMLRVPEEGGKELEVIPVQADGYSVEYLRAVITTAKIFIQPLQCDLDLTPSSSDVS